MLTWVFSTHMSCNNMHLCPHSPLTLQKLSLLPRCSDSRHRQVLLRVFGITSCLEALTADKNTINQLTTSVTKLEVDFQGLHETLKQALAVAEAAQEDGKSKAALIAALQQQLAEARAAPCSSTVLTAAPTPGPQAAVVATCDLPTNDDR